MSAPFNSIRHPIAIDAGLGRLAEETDYAAHVEQLIKQLLFTSPGERIDRPDFGCGLKRMVFAPNSDVAASLVQVSVYEALTKWLSTVIDVSSVQATAADETLSVAIAYVLKARQERKYLNLQVTL
jgi:phage baseplate assembly protein W